MNGIRVEKPTDKPYLNTGHRFYLIGGQDGSFPARGEHLPYEMWGIWMPPIKVLNGFWFFVDKEAADAAAEYEQLPYGSRFVFRKEGEWELERFQFVPQEEKGMVVEAVLKNLSGQDRRFSLDFGVWSHLMPVWLAERAGLCDGADSISFEAETGQLVLKDEKNPWEARIASTMDWRPAEQAVMPKSCQRKENTAYAQLTADIFLKRDESQKVTIWIAASERSFTEAEDTLKRLAAGSNLFLKEKTDFYHRLDETAVLSFPGKPDFEEMYCWTKYINDWIVRKVSDVGEGVVAGYAEFPWWFGNDTNYIAPALLMQGDYESCKSTLRLIRQKSESCNGNGRVVHEVSSNGIVYYEGMTTETPQFADTVWDVYRWSGDKQFLEEMYDFCVRGMAWIEENSVDGLPAGYGINEIAGLDCFCCDTALLAIRGFEILSYMAEELGKEQEAAQYRKKREESWMRFQNEFYMPEYGLYGDMVASKEDIIPRAETWKYTLRSFPITEEEKIMGESSCKQDKSPEDVREKARLKARMEKVIGQAEQMADGSRKAFYLFGFGQSSAPAEFGYLQDKEAKAVYLAQKKMAQQEQIAVGNMMPIGVGREIVSLGNMDSLPEILENIQKVSDGFGKVMPGATSEIYPEQGCFVQAWNSLATMWPYANSIFGIKPNAGKKYIRLKPCIGPQVNGISLKNLPIGGEGFDFSYAETEKEIRVKIPSGEWKVELDSSVKGLKLVIEL